MSKNKGTKRKKGTFFKKDAAQKNNKVKDTSLKVKPKKKNNTKKPNVFFRKKNKKQKFFNERKKSNKKFLKKQRKLQKKKIYKERRKNEKKIKRERKKLAKKQKREKRQKRHEKKLLVKKQRKEERKKQNLTDFHIKNIQKIEKSIDAEIDNKDDKLEKSDLDIDNSLNQIDYDIFGYHPPEFLETPPFQINVKTKQITLEKMDSLKTAKANFIGKSKISQTKMMPVEKQETTLPKEDVSNISATEKFEEPIIDEAMTHIKDCKPSKEKTKDEKKEEYFYSGISGFDNLLEKGIPTGANIIVAGGPGCGKTIFCSQTIYNLAAQGKDCVFLSMEERPDRLRDHMLAFGFKVEEIESSEEQIILRANGKGRISLKRLQPIRLARSIEALLEKASGTLPVDIDLVLDFIPEDFDACLLALDSISAIETAFSGTKRQYRIYIEQLFRYFEEMNLTTFMITESMEAPKRFSNTGVEEFLADGIFVFYNFQGVKKRTRGVEVFKLRGASHSQRIVPMEITSKGMKIDSDESCKNQAKG